MKPRSFKIATKYLLKNVLAHIVVGPNIWFVEKQSLKIFLLSVVNDTLKIFAHAHFSWKSLSKILTNGLGIYCRWLRNTNK